VGVVGVGWCVLGGGVPPTPKNPKPQIPNPQSPLFEFNENNKN